MKLSDAVAGTPVEWTDGKIRDVCSLINGRGFKPHEWRVSGLPIIRIQNLNGSDEFNYFNGPFDQKILVEDRQLLFAWSGSRGTSFGPHVWRGSPGLLNYHTWKVLPHVDRADASFLYYALSKLTIAIEAAAHGASALVHVQKWQMEGFRLAIPPLPEQRAIAEALSDLDRLLGALEALIAKKRAIKQGAMQQLLTGKTRLLGFRREWGRKRLGAHMCFLRTGTYSRAQLASEGPIKYLHYGDIHTSKRVRLEPHVEAMPCLSVDDARGLDRLRSGDVVFVDASEDLDGVGKSVEIADTSGVEVVSGLHTIAVRFDKSVLADGFKAFLQFIPEFRSHLRRLAAGTKVYATARSHLSSAEVRLPTIDEQEAIAAVLSDMDAGIAALERRRDKTRDLKQGMMQQLLTGRVRLVQPAPAEPEPTPAV